MANTITKVDNNTYKTQARGSHMTLIRTSGGWEVWTTNASTRAWCGMPGIRLFNNLAGVEAHYKSWKGITQLASDEKAQVKPSTITFH
ncbi:hypothetical protein [Marinobacter sp. ELB17]|uniref:hypothetical protein n=1 Tax=Marinobacter sp. ELB17 TaxID=270374 RepID=UPI0000F39C6F|nr:hypothetical protein [Marinobacter sp. ELB17]EAZ97229.1 hypothetical protein MELB17_10068 [Marinobacter sp. ELB17]